MASGLNGQRFVFHGYLPVESDKRAAKIVELEKDSIAPRPNSNIHRDALPQSETAGMPYRLLAAMIQFCAFRPT